MSNRVTIDQALHMPIGELVALPAQQIKLLADDVAELKGRTKTAEAVLFSILSGKYGAKAAEIRKVDGRDTGTVRFDDHNDSEVEIVADLPKDVKWNQVKLKGVVATIETEWKENAADYVTTEIKVAEVKFTSWPPAIQKLFEPARTVGTKKETYTIKMKDQE
jgi:hypothetical protein